MKFPLASPRIASHSIASRVYIFWFGLVVGLLFGAVLEIFEILLPRLGSYRVSDFFLFFATVGLVFGGVLAIFKILLPRLGSYRVSRFF